MKPREVGLGWPAWIDCKPLLQGFSSGFPENHVWTATPTDYEGSMVITQHDIDHWHDVEYVFPVQKADGS